MINEPQRTSSDVSSEPSIKKLNGKVTRNEELPFAEGTYYEVWIGLWDKGGEEVGREKTDPEKVGLSFPTTILVTLEFAGGLESTSSTQVIREGAQGLSLWTISALSAQVSFHDYQSLERELPRWAALHHRNILPLYGVYISRTPPLEGPHGLTGIVTNLGSQLYMASVLLRVSERRIDFP